METTTHTGQSLQVRLVKPHGGASYFNFDADTVTPERAVELSAYHAAAQCIPVAYYEVRPDAYPRLNAPPMLTAPGNFYAAA